MRKALEFPRIDEGKLDAVEALIAAIADKEPGTAGAELEDLAARCQKQAKCKLHQDENAFRHVCDAFVQLRHVPCSLRSF